MARIGNIQSGQAIRQGRPQPDLPRQCGTRGVVDEPRCHLRGRAVPFLPVYALLNGSFARQRLAHRPARTSPRRTPFQGRVILWKGAAAPFSEICTVLPQGRARSVPSYWNSDRNALMISAT